MTEKILRALHVVIIIVALIPCSAPAAAGQLPNGRTLSLADTIAAFPEPVLYDLKFKPDYEDRTTPAALVAIQLRLTPGAVRGPRREAVG